VAYVPRLRHDNLLLLGHERAFIGSRRLHERGFPTTTIIHDPTIVRMEVQQFDDAFDDAVRALLDANLGDPLDYSLAVLKDKVRVRIEETRARLYDLVRGV
jgi:hypothetical protein